MKPKVYLETTVISYLTARPSRDVVVAGHQQVTREWWESCHERFEIVVSDLVLSEAAAGDPQAAADRLKILDHLPALATTEAALELAQDLIEDSALPAKAAQDALHLSIAAVNGIEYLATWNCRHLANATMRQQIEMTCRQAGFACPIICTPEEM